MRPESRSADPRLRAVTALARVEAHGAHAARLLGDASPAEREMVLGVLRWQLTLDHLLAPHLRRPAAGLDPAVRAALRAGLYEALRMRTPVPVAVAEAVRVARRLTPPAAGLVNAVLRRAVAATWPDPADPGTPLALRYSHPDWLVERWRSLLGEDALATALAADQQPAPLSLLAAAARCEELEAAGCRLVPHAVVPGVVTVAAGAEAAVAAIRAGVADLARGSLRGVEAAQPRDRHPFPAAQPLRHRIHHDLDRARRVRLRQTGLESDSLHQLRLTRHARPPPPAATRCTGRGRRLALAGIRRDPRCPAR